MYPIYFFLLAIISAIIQIVVWHTSIAETFLLWILFCNVGLQGIFGFAGHFFLSEKIAKSIGWPVGNPFQLEIAFTNLAFGVLGILCLWLRGNFWLAVIIGRSVFAWGAAYVHLMDMKKRGNFNFYNVGPVLYFGILLPIVLFALWLMKYFL